MRKIKNFKIIISRFLFNFGSGISNAANAQEIPDEPSTIVEQQLENLTESNEDVETEDDAYLQEMHHFLKEPINLNYADAGHFGAIEIIEPCSNR